MNRRSEVGGRKGGTGQRSEADRLAPVPAASAGVMFGFGSRRSIVDRQHAYGPLCVPSRRLLSPLTQAWSVTSQIRNRGSIASRSPLPTRLNVVTVMKMAIDGTTTSHQLW
jgi:hypothetical protein